MDWRADPTVLGLTFITVSAGVAGMSESAEGVAKDQQVRAVVETLLIGAVAAHATKSWWPIVGPAAYLAFDYAWSVRRGHVPTVGADTETGYDDGR